MADFWDKLFRATERWPVLMLLGLLVVAAVLRATNIAYTGLWLDESYTFQVANGHFPPLEHLPGVQSAQFYYDHFIAWQPMDVGWLIQLLIINVHLPLYYLLLNPWLGVFGVNPESLRAFSAVFSVLTLLPLYGIARAMGGPRLGWLVALFAALSPVQIYYGQEGRMYAMTLFWAVLSSLSLWKVLYAERPRPWLGLYTLTLVAGFFSHYVFSLFLAFHAVFAGVEMFRRPQKRHWGFVLPAVALGLCITLWLPIYQLQNAGIEDNYHFAKSLVAWTRYLEPFFWQPFLMLAGENNGVRAFYIPVTALLLLGWLYRCFRERPGFTWRKEGFLLCWFLVPLLVQVGLDVVKHTHTSIIGRYLVLVTPVMLIWLSLWFESLLQLPQKAARIGASLLLLGMVAMAIGTVWAPSPLRDTHNKKDMGGIVAYFYAHRQPGDLVAVNGPNGEAGLMAYYLMQHDPSQSMLYWVSQERGHPFGFPDVKTFVPFSRVWFYQHRSNETRGLDTIMHALNDNYGPLTVYIDEWMLYGPQKAAPAAP